MQKIIFVCTGNTCRSPMAETISKKIMFEVGLELLIQSRGLAVLKGEPAHQHAINAMEIYNLDLSRHRATQFTHLDCLGEPLVLTMTLGHKMQLQRLYPKLEGNIFTISEYAEAQGDITDPYGSSQDIYDECAKELYKLLNIIFKRLQEEIK